MVSSSMKWGFGGKWVWMVYQEPGVALVCTVAGQRVGLMLEAPLVAEWG